jgi:predicted DNA-binding transcriptional regulator YafY
MAYCRLRKALRTFVPARITKLELRRESFEPPVDFDASTHFRRAFGIVSDEKTTSVELLFEAEVAHYIAERNWHPTQHMVWLDNRALRMTLKCTQTTELIRWIMSWGAEVVVEQPQGLVREIRKRHALAAVGT